jgi:hypothetical protein
LNGNLVEENKGLTGTIPVGLFPTGRGKMTRLFLGRNNLSGSLPPEISRQTLLQLIRIDNNNKMVGPLPTVLPVNIVYFHISDCDKIDSTIPATWAQHTLLTQLSLDASKLHGTVPLAFWQDLTRLRQVELQNSKVSGSLPAIVGKLTDLVGLNCANNQMTGTLPPELSALKKLRVLSAGRNSAAGGNMSGTIPPQLSTLLALTILTLASREFHGSIPSQLGSMLALSRINIYANGKMTGSLPVELSNLVSLDQLNVGNHAAFGGSIPPQYGKMVSLRYFRVTASKLSGSIPPQFGNLQEMTYLYISSNKMVGSLPQELSRLGQLLGMRIYSQPAGKMDTTIPSGIGLLTKLTYLSLDMSGQMKGAIPPQLSRLTNLATFRLITSSAAPKLCRLDAGAADALAECSQGQCDVSLYPACGCAFARCANPNAAAALADTKNPVTPFFPTDALCCDAEATTPPVGGGAKGSYTVPDRFEVSWTLGATDVTFTLKAPADGWLALGVAPGAVIREAHKEMDTAFASAGAAGIIELDMYSRNTGGSAEDGFVNEVRDLSKQNLRDVRGTNENGVTEVTFTKDYDTGDSEDTLMGADVPLFISWARHSTEDQYSLTKHDDAGSFIVASLATFGDQVFSADGTVAPANPKSTMEYKSPDGDFEATWSRVDDGDESVRFSLRARVVGGWFAVGIASLAPGSTFVRTAHDSMDTVQVKVNGDGSVDYMKGYSDATGRPVADAEQVGLSDVSGSVDGDWTSVSFTRPRVAADADYDVTMGEFAGLMSWSIRTADDDFSKKHQKKGSWSQTQLLPAKPPPPTPPPTPTPTPKKAPKNPLDFGDDFSIVITNDKESETVHFALRWRGTGWASVGIGKSDGAEAHAADGTMDTLTAWVDDGGAAHVVDGVSRAQTQPKRDALQHVTGVAGSSTDGVNVVEFMRVFDTASDDDVVFGTDVMLAIWFATAPDNDLLTKHTFQRTVVYNFARGVALSNADAEEEHDMTAEYVLFAMLGGVLLVALVVKQHLKIRQLKSKLAVDELRTSNTNVCEPSVLL